MFINKNNSTTNDLNTAIEKSKDIIAREHTLKLSQKDSMLLVDALDATPKIHLRLQQAAQLSICYKL